MRILALGALPSSLHTDILSGCVRGFLVVLKLYFDVSNFIRGETLSHATYIPTAQPYGTKIANAKRVIKIEASEL
jgi:hypothetical protein